MEHDSNEDRQEGDTAAHCGGGPCGLSSNPSDEAGRSAGVPVPQQGSGTGGEGGSGSRDCDKENESPPNSQAGSVCVWRGGAGRLWPAAAAVVALEACGRFM